MEDNVRETVTGGETRMLVYSGIKSDFMERCEADSIADDVRAAIRNKMNVDISKTGGEYKSWVNSLNYMYKVLNTPAIPQNAGVAIEYNVPNTAKRVDFMLSGFGETREPHVVVVELKQWDSIRKINNREALVETALGGGIRRTVHPSYQAWTYAEMIRNYNEYAQQENVAIHPCACMHNYHRLPTNDPIDDDCYREWTSEAPVFTSGQVAELRQFMTRFVREGDDCDLLYRIDHGRIKPSKSLQDAISGMLSGNREFDLIDDQRVIFEDILAISRASAKDGKKRTVIVQGGPGTGKSVVAVNLLARLTAEEQFCQYTSKNGAPRRVYKRKLKGTARKSVIDAMFVSSDSYYTSPDNVVDTILADEAHRLNAKSGVYKNNGENQIKEIISAAKCSVFFIDESQRVTVFDIGSADEIRRHAKFLGSEIFEMELTSQFRCNGSDGYLAWLDNTLEIRQTANTTLEGINYKCVIFDTPEAMRREIIALNDANRKSRILAGYCWEWPTATRKDTRVHDIKIGDFEMSWNLDDGKEFALEDSSINEAGCIHTTQGLEFDYVGVIIGNDMRFEDGHVVTDFRKRASTDSSLSGIKTMAKSDPERAAAIADEIIKNTYRTLMTRGMKGCYVYCVDGGLRDHLRESLGRYDYAVVGL